MSWQWSSRCLWCLFFCWSYLQVTPLSLSSCLKHLIFFSRIFNDVDCFKSLYWICYNIVSVWHFVFFDHEACGILVPPSVIEPPTSALGGDLNHCTTREVPKHLICMCAAHAQVSWTEEKVRELRQWLLKAASVEELYPRFFWKKKVWGVLLLKLKNDRKNK